MGVERRPHGLAHPTGQLDRGNEVDVIHIEQHLPLLDGIVKLHGDSVRGGQFGEQIVNISREMERGAATRRILRWISPESSNRAVVVGKIGRRHAGSFFQALPGEFVVRVEIESGAEFVGGSDPRIFHQQQIPPLHVAKHQLRLYHIARRKELHILRSQPRGRVELQ